MKAPSLLMESDEGMRRTLTEQFNQLLKNAGMDPFWEYILEYIRIGMFDGIVKDQGLVIAVSVELGPHYLSPRAGAPC